MNQALNALTSRAWIAPIAKLATVCTQSAADISLFRTHMLEGFSLGHGERLQRCARPDLRNVPSTRNRSFKLPSRLR